MFDNSDRNPLSGPPETTRDVIMAGARALEKGDWKQCTNHILALPVWTHLGSEECVSKVKETLQVLVYMRPHTAMYVPEYYYLCVRMLLSMCPQLQYMCPYHSLCVLLLSVCSR